MYSSEARKGSQSYSQNDPKEVWAGNKDEQQGVVERLVLLQR